MLRRYYNNCNNIDMDHGARMWQCWGSCDLPADCKTYTTTSAVGKTKTFVLLRAVISQPQPCCCSRCRSRVQQFIQTCNVSSEEYVARLLVYVALVFAVVAQWQLQARSLAVAQLQATWSVGMTMALKELTNVYQLTTYNNLSNDQVNLKKEKIVCYFYFFYLFF